MKFPKQVLIDILNGDNKQGRIVKNTIADTTRWSVVYEMVFEVGGKFYATGYSRGATESQDERPFEYEEDEIECPEVVAKEVTITTYVAV